MERWQYCPCGACERERKRVATFPDDTKNKDKPAYQAAAKFYAYVGFISRREFILMNGAED